MSWIAWAWKSVVLLAAGLSLAQDGATRLAAGHRFACCDYTQGRVFIVAASGRIEWEYPAPSCNDLWVLADGHVLFDTGHGVQEVDHAGNVLFRYESASEIYACQRLPDGNTLVGESTAGRLVEVDHSGKVVKEVRLLPPGKSGGHLYMRNARRLENGHYLVCHYGEQVVREYDARGTLIREIPARGGPHTAVRLPGGNTLIACGDASPDPAGVFEVDSAGKTVWQVKGNDLPGISLKFNAGLHRLSNGHTVLSNWLGHGHLGQGPHLIEVTPDRRVVWTYADHRAVKSVASVQVLDDRGGAGVPLH